MFFCVPSSTGPDFCAIQPETQDNQKEEALRARKGCPRDGHQLRGRGRRRGRHDGLWHNATANTNQRPGRTSGHRRLQDAHNLWVNNRRVPELGQVIGACLPPDPVMTLLPPGQELNVAYLMEERKQRIDKDPNAPPFDDLRNFTFEGSGSIAESLSSLASGGCFNLIVKNCLSFDALHLLFCWHNYIWISSSDSTLVII